MLSEFLARLAREIYFFHILYCLSRDMNHVFAPCKFPDCKHFVKAFPVAFRVREVFQESREPIFFCNFRRQFNGPDRQISSFGLIKTLCAFQQPGFNGIPTKLSYHISFLSNTIFYRKIIAYINFLEKSYRFCKFFSENLSIINSIIFFLSKSYRLYKFSTEKLPVK